MKIDENILLLNFSKITNITSTEIVNVLEGCAKELGLSYMLMNSGAVHDNAMLKDFVDTGMIFVPSIKGISHSPYEDTNSEDIIAGANLLLKSVVTLGNSITGHAIHRMVEK